MTGEGWEIIHARWQDSDPPTADVIITDPPYSSRTIKNARSLGATVQKTIQTFDEVSPAEVIRLLPLSRRWLIVFCELEQLGEYRRLGGSAYVRGGVWIKTNGAPQFSGDRPAQGAEGIAVLHRAGKKRWNGGGHPLTFLGPVAQKRRLEIDHDTPKPLWIMREIVRLFSDPGELVWDPYCGSGTTGDAALKRGRRFVGHELQEHYALGCAARLSRVLSDLGVSHPAAKQAAFSFVPGDAGP